MKHRLPVLSLIILVLVACKKESETSNDLKSQISGTIWRNPDHSDYSDTYSLLSFSKDSAYSTYSGNVNGIRNTSVPIGYGTYTIKGSQLTTNFKGYPAFPGQIGVVVKTFEASIKDSVLTLIEIGYQTSAANRWIKVK